MTSFPFLATSNPPEGLAKAYLRLADHRSIAVFVSAFDPKSGRNDYVFVNRAATRLLDATSAQLLGTPVVRGRLGEAALSLDDPEDATRGRTLALLGTLTLPDGRRLTVRWTRVETVVDGRAFAVQLVRSSDGLPAVERVLLDSELRFRRLMDVAPDGILVLLGDRVVYANQAITQIHGYSHPRQLSQLGLARLVSSEDLGTLEQRLALLREDSSAVYSLELRAIRRDRVQVPVEVVLLRTEWDDKPADMLTVRDLSGRRIMQNQLIHNDRLAAVGTLAAGVAHEINNPLAYVLLNLQYLLREVPRQEENYDRVGHLLERLREARHGAERVVSIVKDLRTFSKSDEEQLGPVDLRQVLRNAVKVARTQLMDRGQIIEAIADVPSAVGHASRLEQVFLNLLINAIQALPVERREQNLIRVRSFVERQGEQQYVTVEVMDNGLGMAPATLNRVFDPFFTTKPVGLGTGLGLPICHSIVTRMGGSIRVESELGVGTTFLVSLPTAVMARRHVTPYPASLPAPDARRARILVVDDELPVATMMSRVLEEEHDVEVATSAEYALELLEQRRFDVVFCDLLMPAMTGMDFHAEVMRRFPGQEQRIVFMSGGAFTSRATRFLSRVQNPRLEKPFDLRAVRSIVRELMRREG
ncbi:MAG: ATP-binding protein [Polyangiaceae bacterium]